MKKSKTEIEEMNLNDEISNWLKHRKIEHFSFVDISELANEQTQNYRFAILFGIVLSKKYISRVSEKPDYVEELKRNKTIKNDEFNLTEQKTDCVADELAGFLNKKGFHSLSQSEKSLEKSGLYNLETNTTPLPHKTLAIMAAWGWIGKNNLLVNPDFGCAVSMCSVLTNAPLNCKNALPVKPNCGDCRLCTTVCLPKALTGKPWDKSTKRDDIIDVKQCNTCLQCMVWCPFTLNYLA